MMIFNKHLASHVYIGMIIQVCDETKYILNLLMLMLIKLNNKHLNNRIRNRGYENITHIDITEHVCRHLYYSTLLIYIYINIMIFYTCNLISDKLLIYEIYNYRHDNKYY